MGVTLRWPAFALAVGFALGAVRAPLPARAATPALFEVLNGTFACSGEQLTENLTFRVDRNGVGALGEVRAADGTVWAEDLLIVDPAAGTDDDAWMQWRVAPSPGAPSWPAFFGRSKSRGAQRQYFGASKSPVAFEVTSNDAFTVVRPADGGGAHMTCSRVPSVPCLVPDLVPTTLFAAAPESVFGHTGLVDVKLDLNAASNIERVAVLRSSDPALNGSARTTVEQSVFRTRRSACRFVSDSYLFRIQYRYR